MACHNECLWAEDSRSINTYLYIHIHLFVYLKFRYYVCMSALMSVHLCKHNCIAHMHVCNRWFMMVWCDMIWYDTKRNGMSGMRWCCVCKRASQHMPLPVGQNACLRIRGYEKLASFLGSSLNHCFHHGDFPLLGWGELSDHFWMLTRVSLQMLATPTFSPHGQNAI